MSSAKKCLQRIAEIIESVDDRCLHADGEVSATLLEMTQEEISEIYQLARRGTVGNAKNAMPGYAISDTAHTPFIVYLCSICGRTEMRTLSEDSYYHMECIHDGIFYQMSVVKPL